MSKPDGSTAAASALGLDSLATTLPAAHPAEQPPGPTPSVVAAAPAGAAASSGAPKRGTRNRAESHPRLDADLQAVIGHQLRAVYHEVLNEPVPDRFVRLLEQLATKSADQQ